MNTNKTYLQGIVSAVHEKEGGSEIERHAERNRSKRGNVYMVVFI